MRQLILIAGLVLASASAQAGDRSLSLSSSDAFAVTAPARPIEISKTAEAPQAAAPQAAEAPKAEAPKYIERPAVVEPKAEAPKADAPKADALKAAQSNTEPAKPVAEKTVSASKADKARRQRYWTEGRIISELHRYGIYW